MAALQRLCETVGVSADVATKIAAGLRDASPPAPPDAAASAASSAASGGAVSLPPPSPMSPLMPRSASQLTWFGVDPGVVRLLEPFVTILPEKTFVNVNTAPREVLVAAIAGLDVATAERILQARQRVPLKTTADLQALAPSLPADSLTRLMTGSR